MRVVHVTDDPGSTARLRESTGAGFHILPVAPGDLERVAQNAEEARRCEAAVGGFFPVAFLAAAADLRNIVIPFAGVPRRTRTVLSEFPAIRVYNSHFNAPFAAEHAWALLLAAGKRILLGDRSLRSNDWYMRYEEPSSIALRGATLLLIGYGAIGRHLAPMAKAFGMRVHAIRRRPAVAGDGVSRESDYPGTPADLMPRDIDLLGTPADLMPRDIDLLGTPADLPELLPQADAIIVCLPDTDATTGLIGRREFARMKRGAILVNVGRGGAIDEDAFYEALRDGTIGGAGIDTWWAHPGSLGEIADTPPSRHPLASFDTLVMSPHRAAHVTIREEERLRSVAEILRAIAAGNPPAEVDRTEWY